jgi:hypothetical protein
MSHNKRTAGRDVILPWISYKEKKTTKVVLIEISGHFLSNNI